MCGGVRVCVCLAELHGMWGLGSSARDGTRAPWGGSVGSSPLGHQGSR